MKDDKGDVASAVERVSEMNLHTSGPETCGTCGAVNSAVHPVDQVPVLLQVSGMNVSLTAVATKTTTSEGFLPLGTYPIRACRECL